MQLTFYNNNCKWNITSKNCESLYYTAVTHAIHQIYINFTKFQLQKKKKKRYTGGPAVAQQVKNLT